MKKFMHFFGFALLIVCCSFTKGKTHTSATNIEHNETSFFKEKASSTSVELVFLKAIQAEETTINQGGSNTLPFISEESIVKPFIANKSLEQFIKFQFLQYTNTEKNFLILSRKSDLIFPFHYHW